eukprot:TRINITY_DN17334_c0_g1_i1.p1 TRINITY_DN17334_c0_g1~~TRINITY_DN17334_c0_g1_i1.p1  ORF type:complete len:394 (+),score=81.77 TRINITY_DN17334_c0_g1_i1:586-1767(+)
MCSAAFRISIVQARFALFLQQAATHVSDLRDALTRERAARVIQSSVWLRIKAKRELRVKRCIQILRKRKLDKILTARAKVRRRRRAVPALLSFIRGGALLPVRVAVSLRRTRRAVLRMQRFARCLALRRGVQLGVLSVLWDREEEALKAAARAQDARALRNEVVQRARQAGIAVEEKSRRGADDPVSDGRGGRRRSQAMISGRGFRPLEGDASALAVLARIGAHNLQDEALLERAAELGYPHCRTFAFPPLWRRHEMMRIVKEKRSQHAKDLDRWQQDVRTWIDRQHHYRVQVAALPRGRAAEMFIRPPVRPRRPVWSVMVRPEVLGDCIERGWVAAAGSAVVRPLARRQSSAASEVDESSSGVQRPQSPVSVTPAPALTRAPSRSPHRPSPC